MADELEINLRLAWSEVYQRLCRNRILLRTRRRRVARLRQQHNQRAWCITLRASDSRIDERYCCLLSRKDADQQEAHTVLIPSRYIAKLNRPVELRYPGCRIDDAAALLGVHRGTVLQMVKAGVLEARREMRNCFLARRRSAALCGGCWSKRNRSVP